MQLNPYKPNPLCFSALTAQLNRSGLVGGDAGGGTVGTVLVREKHAFPLASGLGRRRAGLVGTLRGLPFGQPPFLGIPGNGRELGRAPRLAS